MSLHIERIAVVCKYTDNLWSFYLFFRASADHTYLMCHWQPAAFIIIGSLPSSVLEDGGTSWHLILSAVVLSVHTVLCHSLPADILPSASASCPCFWIPCHPIVTVGSEAQRCDMETWQKDVFYVAIWNPSDHSATFPRIFFSISYLWNYLWTGQYPFKWNSWRLLNVWNNRLCFIISYI